LLLKWRAALPGLAAASRLPTAKTSYGCSGRDFSSSGAFIAAIWFTGIKGCAAAQAQVWRDAYAADNTDFPFPSGRHHLLVNADNCKAPQVGLAEKGSASLGCLSVYSDSLTLDRCYRLAPVPADISET
jgi:hypothetical protein